MALRAGCKAGTRQALLCDYHRVYRGRHGHELPGHQRHRHAVLVIGDQRRAGWAATRTDSAGREQSPGDGASNQRFRAESTCRTNGRADVHRSHRTVLELDNAIMEIERDSPTVEDESR